LTLTRGPYGSPSYEIVRILVCLSYFLDADEVENNPEYFKLVEEEPKEEGMLAYAAGYIPSSPIKHSITHEEYTKILKEAEMK